MNAFVQSIKNQSPTPLDSNDSTAWSIITPLSEQSITQDYKPIYFPDFTRGRWMNRKPVFVIDDTN